jgi:putative ABC transport system ATP-binding protein
MIGIENRDDARPKQLSGGQQQRVAIARALVHEPKIVICDEPTSALDAETGGQIMELLAEIASDPDRTVIVVTHDSRIFKYANRITKMDDGRVTAVLTNGDSDEDFVS